MANVVRDSELHRIVLSCIVYRRRRVSKIQKAKLSVFSNRGVGKEHNALYNDKQQYLITRRAPTVKVFPGKWHPPGGGMETSDYVDTPADAEGQWYNVLEKTLRREVKEEVNVAIGKPEYLLDLTFIRPDNVPVLVLTYYAPYVSGEVDISKEEDTDDYAWVSAIETRDYDLIKGIADEIKMVDTILNKQKK